MNFTTIGRFLFPPEIEKPLSSTDTYDFVEVRKDYFDMAKKRSMAVVVRTPTGESIFNPKAMTKWKVVKFIGYYRDNPMSMYQLMINRGQWRPREFFEGSSV